MSEDGTQVVQGVAAPQAAKRRRVIGGDAEAALRERLAQRAGEEMVFTLRGKEYRLLVPTPAPALLHAALAATDAGFGELIEAIRSAFHPDDAEAFVAELMRTDVEHPADVEYITDLLNTVLEATTSRPESS